MSQDRERLRLIQSQSNSSQDNYQTLFTRPPGHSPRYPSQENAPFSYAHAETDRLGASPGHRLDIEGDWKIADRLGGSLAGLELNGNESYTNSKIPEGTYSRRYNIGMDADQPQNGAATIDPFLTPESLSGTHTILTPSQPSNSAESPPAWPYSGHWSGRDSLSLYPPTFTPHRSSAGTHSLHSGSAWETDPSPSADEDDLLPLPDSNFASIQSYNDPRTGIWAQENAYAQGTMYSTIGDMSYVYGISSTTQPLPQHLQQIMADAEAATPFGAQCYSNGRGHALSAHAGLGAAGRPHSAASSFTQTSTRQNTLPQLSHRPMIGQAPISIVIDNPTDLEPSSAQHPLKPERSFSPLANNHCSPSPYIIAPRVPSDNPNLAAAATLTSIQFISSPTPATTSPSRSTDTSTSIVVGCPEIGCRAKFTGTAWKDSLRRHRKDQHGDNEKLICPVCHTVFRSGRPDNLKRHILGQHPGHDLPESRHVRTRRSAPKRRRE